MKRINMVVFTSSYPEHMCLGWGMQNIRVYYNFFKYTEAYFNEMSLRYGNA